MQFPGDTHELFGSDVLEREDADHRFAGDRNGVQHLDQHLDSSHVGFTRCNKHGVGLFVRDEANRLAEIDVVLVPRNTAPHDFKTANLFLQRPCNRAGHLLLFRIEQ